MRNNIVHFGADEQHYEIREIVEVAYKIKEIGKKEIIWENIGDPVIKGEKIPDWLKDIVSKATRDDITYAYSPSKGVDATRKFLAEQNGKITSEDIIFFNGLGEAINKIYGYLNRNARVLGPNPAYPTHSSSEATHAGSSHLTYELDPDNEWNPNLEEIENKVKYNPNISAILVINPDNPTGAVFSRETLEGIVNIAKKYNLFVLFDEIYEKLTFDIKDHILLKDIIGDVCGIAMKGLSKEVPWPGSRCGWIEIYNQDKDEEFAKFINSIYFSKMLEVCSTTLPQTVLPEIYKAPEFNKYLSERISKYKKNSDIVEEILGPVKGLKFVRPKGAYYLTVLIDDFLLVEDFFKDLKDKNLEKFVREISIGKKIDKKFCYYLLATTGICTVPLSGFNSPLPGLRMTLLEDDEQKFRKILEEIVFAFENIKK
ncbi:MAG: pyridoxal phosphate-dependent aminotransferase [Candidatus Gracilibacteria bacterium]|nr:pyridoxal phosphate-dependent aminotransferase [Candidatus Gracilibacteria bacterium]